MLIIAFFLSAVLLTIVIVAGCVWGNRAASVVAGLAIPASFATIFLMFWLPVFSLQAFLLLVGSVACLLASASRKVFTTTSLAATCVSYAIMGLFAANHLRDQIALEHRYPVESMK